jgi:hypothetical protein
MSDGATLDSAVRLAVYEHFLARGSAPSAADLAPAVGRSAVEVADAFRRLGEAHVLVLTPGEGDPPALWMAMPFSAVPTDFRVETEPVAGSAGAWWANCAWDALGIAVLLHDAGRLVAPVYVRTSCPDCDEPLRLEVRPDTAGAEVAGDGAGPAPVVHLLVPAARWWDDIGFT